MIFRFTPEADAELTEARQWYSHHRKDLDLEFMECIEAALSRIQSNPRLPKGITFDKAGIFD
jgi:hypothetical protein